MKELPGALDKIVVQIYARLHLGHGLDEAGPVLLRQSLVSSKACEEADMADVALRVVLRWRRPAGDDVPHTVQPVLGGIGAKQAEASTEAVFHGFKVTKGLTPALSRGRGRKFVPVPVNVTRRVYLS